MIAIKWFFLVFVNMVLKYGVNLPLVPGVVLFADQAGNLPTWLYWFCTPDNPLDGDAGWKAESRTFLNESNRFKRYVNRCFWLWRNSLYGFNESVLSVKSDGTERLIVGGNPHVGNGPAGVSGLVMRVLYRDGKMIAWQWYFIRRLKHWPHKCVRINLGWKLWQFKHDQPAFIHLAFSGWINKFTL